MSSDLLKRFSTLSHFTGPSLTETLRHIEARLLGVTRDQSLTLLNELNANKAAWIEATEIKHVAAQIDMTIHALGILLCLPQIIEPGEQVEYASLGAGNTGREFDLETNLRVAEFKFIRWRGGAESIRQDHVFKDFFTLAEADTNKRKFLYLQGVEHALKFLRGRRSLNSVLSRNNNVREKFSGRFGDRFERVGDYFAHYDSAVSIEDISAYLPQL